MSAQSRSAGWGLYVGLSLLCSCSARANGSSSMQNSQANQGQAASLLRNQPPGPMELIDLQMLLRMTRERDRPYIRPSTEDLDRTTEAGLTLFKEAQSARCIRATPIFRQAGFEMAVTALGGAPAFAVRELPDNHIGGGVYIIRQGAVPRERIIQVPHSFFDVGTLEIGMELASASAARALFVNTVHRYQGGRPAISIEEERSESPSDLAHQEATFFQRMTGSALATFPQLQVIQVHGFGDGSVPESWQAAVVVSPGAAPAGADEAAKVAARLGALLGTERVLLFPRDTRRLGAQTNVQGRLVAAHRTATFLHLELSRTLRNRLRQDADLLRAFIAAVIGGDKS